MIHKLMLRVFVVTLFLIATLCMAPRPARAEDPLGALGIIVIVGALVGTYVATMTTICTPVAAIRASDHPEGFGGAFGDCFYVTNWFASKPVQAAEQKEEDVVLNTSPVEESEPGIGAESQSTEHDTAVQMEASAGGDSGEE